MTKPDLHGLPGLVPAILLIMSWTLLTGKMTGQSVKKHHPQWYKERTAASSAKKDPEDEEHA